MGTALIEGMQPSRFDRELLQDIEFIGVPRQADSNEAWLIGIRDEHGDVYRVIDMAGRSNATYLIEKLRELGYWDEAPNLYEAELGYDRIINVVKAGRLKR